MLFEMDAKDQQEVADYIEKPPVLFRMVFYCGLANSIAGERLGHDNHTIDVRHTSGFVAVTANGSSHF